MAGPSDSLIAKLVGQLQDGDPVVRRNAAGALRLHGQRAVRAIPALDNLLADEDARVRAEAHNALDHLRRCRAA